MSTLNHLLDVQDQICYVQCSFCTTILLVSVPYSSMSMVVTVRCGHCTGLLSVNMLKASFVPLHVFSALNQDQLKHQEEGDASKVMDRHSTTLSMAASSEEDNNDDDDDDEDDLLGLEQIVNKPPEKKRRAPSAYNRFIKEEIRRLKVRNPNMSHKEAFSTAAKNWAHFPSVHHEVDEENCSSEKGNLTQNLEVAPDQVRLEGKGFSERKPLKALNILGRDNYKSDGDIYFCLQTKTTYLAMRLQKEGKRRFRI